MSESLIAFHRELADAALLERLASGALTDEARRIALDECARRRLSIPTPDLPPTSVTAAGLRPFITHLDWTDAQVLKSLLESEGIPVHAADSHLATANPFLSNATGGIRLWLPENHLARAHEIVRMLKEGAFQIDENIDVGSPES